MAAGAPTFVACNARSGSTLLRWLLDTHAQISCPGETDVAVVLDSFVRSSGALDPSVPGPVHLARAREVVDALMAKHLNAVGKQRWCDKSLSNVTHLDQLAAAWPDAQFILLHRHCMDMIASALEASEWGLDTFGFGPYAQMSPTNAVLALAGYWVERTAIMLSFEERFGDRCVRLRYEDLVTSTESAMDAVWARLSVRPSAVARAAFAVEHDALSPGDYKIWYTRGVHAGSVGRGARVPPERLAGPLRDTVNDLLQRLGYPLVDDWWGSGDGVPDGPVAPGSLELRIVEGHVVRARAVIDPCTPSPAPVEERRTGSPCVVAVEHDALDALRAGAENFGAAVRRRRVRRYGELPARFVGEKAFFDWLDAHLTASPRQPSFGALAEAGIGRRDDDIAVGL